MSGRNSQVARIFSLLNVLENSKGAHTVGELHQRLLSLGHDVEKRTIYRDIEALSQAGFPLFQEGEDKSNMKWKLSRNTNINQYFVLTAKELFALYLARGVLKPLNNTPFYEDLNAVFSKIEERLGLKQVEHLDLLEKDLRFEPGPQWGLSLSPEVLETVRAACAESHLLECVYYSANSKTETTRKLGPHYLYYAKGGLYLVAEDLSDQKLKVFALPRMKSAEMLMDAYEKKVSTPEDLFNNSFGVFASGKLETVVLEFEPIVAEFVRERRWHSSQRIVNLEGGRIRLTLEVTDTPELHSWILGFGPNAKIIEPATLAEKVAVKAFETAAQYRKTG